MVLRIQSKILTGQSSHLHAKLFPVRILAHGCMHMTNRASLFIVGKSIGLRILETYTW